MIVISGCDAARSCAKTEIYDCDRCVNEFNRSVKVDYASDQRTMRQLIGTNLSAIKWWIDGSMKTDCIFQGVPDVQGARVKLRPVTSAIVARGYPRYEPAGNFSRYQRGMVFLKGEAC